MSASPITLKTAGLDKAEGVITATSFKTLGDPQWIGDPEFTAWLAFMRTYYPMGDVNDALTFVGYSNAVLFADVLRRCGDDLTRENLMAVATHLEGVRMPFLLPGITLSTSSDRLQSPQANAAAALRWKTLAGVRRYFQGVAGDAGQEI